MFAFQTMTGSVVFSKGVPSFPGHYGNKLPQVASALPSFPTLSSQTFPSYSNLQPSVTSPGICKKIKSKGSAWISVLNLCLSSLSPAERQRWGPEAAFLPGGVDGVPAAALAQPPAPAPRQPPTLPDQLQPC